jgi:hypothetical protein
MLLVGQTEAGSAEVQPARDSRFKATNCRWGVSCTSAVPFHEHGQFRALQCLKKPDKNSSAKGSFNICRRQEKSLNNKVDLSNSR